MKRHIYWSFLLVASLLLSKCFVSAQDYTQAEKLFLKLLDGENGLAYGTREHIWVNEWFSLGMDSPDLSSLSRMVVTLRTLLVWIYRRIFLVPKVPWAARNCDQICPPSVIRASYGKIMSNVVDPECSVYESCSITMSTLAPKQRRILTCNSNGTSSRRKRDNTVITRDLCLIAKFK